MIQFNLLPDIKQQFIRAQRLKRLMVSVSMIASAAGLALLVVAFSTVYIAQKKIIDDLNGSIASSSRTLKNEPNISDILTVQSQLGSLDSLNNQKPVVSRIFGYLTQLTPTQITVSDMHVDFTQNTITITGNAPSLDLVNTFVDSLKFTSYTATGSTSSQPAFSSVVLANFSRSATSATYSINFSFDPTIFSVANDVTLAVGNQNQSSQEPSIIFKKGN
jgi:Tfp pilus assembly protein PilN